MTSGTRTRKSLTPGQVAEITAKLKEYNYKGHTIRTMRNDEQVWIVFADICKALGYKNPSHESKKVRDAEKCKLEIGLKNTLAVCINSAGLYSFVLFSNKQSAKDFRDWAVKEIFNNAHRR